MKNKINKKIFGYVLANLLFVSSCAFANPVKDMSNKILKMDIASYEIKWLTRIEKPNPHSDYKIIFKGEDENTIQSIKDTINNLYHPGGSQFGSVRAKAQGTLILKDINEKIIEIDICYGYFFAGHKRSPNALFNSAELAKIIGDIVSKRDSKNILVITEDFFDEFSNYKK